MAENIEIPENADKILYAEDLMNHVLSNTIRTAFLTTTFEKYRDFIHNAFNDDMRAAVSLLYNKVDFQNEDVFYAMLDENSVNIATYKMYAENISKKYFSEGFDAGCFLHYCVRLAGVAVYFYNNGILEAPNLAVAYITNALNNVDMTTGGWDTLNTVGKMYANIENDTVKQLSPQTTSDEEASSSSGEQNLFKDQPSNCIVVQRESSCYSIKELEEGEIRIQRVLNEFYCSSNNNNSTETKLKDLKESCSTPLVDVSAILNVDEKKVEDESSFLDTPSPGTSNTTEKYISSIKDDCKINTDLPLKDISNDNDQNIPPARSDKESHMLGVSKSDKHNSTLTDEENNLPKEDGS